MQRLDRKISSHQPVVVWREPKSNVLKLMTWKFNRLGSAFSRDEINQDYGIEFRDHNPSVFSKKCNAKAEPKVVLALLDDAPALSRRDVPQLDRLKVGCNKPSTIGAEDCLLHAFIARQIHQYTRFIIANHSPQPRETIGSTGENEFTGGIRTDGSHVRSGDGQHGSG